MSEVEETTEKGVWIDQAEVSRYLAHIGDSLKAIAKNIETTLENMEANIKEKQNES